MFEQKLLEKYPELLEDKQKLYDKLVCVFRFRCPDICGMHPLTHIQIQRLDKILNEKYFDKDKFIRYCYAGITQKYYHLNRSVQQYMLKHLFGDDYEEWLDLIYKSYHYDKIFRRIIPKE